MSSEKTTAWVLQVVPFSETSSILTLFTRDFGKLGAMAKGARRLETPTCSTPGHRPSDASRPDRSLDRRRCGFRSSRRSVPPHRSAHRRSWPET
ncbi:MAG: recombination protein O N-terminal domain-containing protein, partial [Planctomycetes bacterium]|nr:recombination protein O N-terminal domain-containing protein [Planctomycetota bacterium]